MKPTEKTARVLIWRFREIGIEITYQRQSRHWGGKITPATGPASTLALTTLDQIVSVHRLQEYVAC